MSSATETGQRAGFIERIEHLIERGEQEQARILGREVVKNATDIDIFEDGGHVIVETPHFQGRHEFVDQNDHRFVSEQGIYRYKSERFDFHFRVFTLNARAKQQLYPEEILRGGSQTTPDGTPEPEDESRANRGRFRDLIDRLSTKLRK